MFTTALDTLEAMILKQVNVSLLNRVSAQPLLFHLETR